ncbi:dienelactone hydrolase family protein [Sphingomonas montanisoli]|nr:dienelactone hydrolase family protein [Sphingomonas montanisoli]
MIEEKVRYGAGDSHGRLFVPEGASSRPGVIVFPGGGGIGEAAYRSARRLAEQGYVTLAADYYGGGYRGADMGDAENLRRFQELLGDVGLMRSRAKEAFDVLAARPEVDAERVAAIGYCFGGAMAVEFALSGAALRAAIGFHMLLNPLTLSDAGKLKARLLVCNGTRDPYAPIEDVVAFEAGMRDHDAQWQVNLYGGVRHSFTDPDATGDPEVYRYDAHADRESWNAATFLLRDAFGS